jgi:Ca2+-binding RTX toxin-like protein
VAPDNNPLVSPVYSDVWQYVLAGSTTSPSAVTYKQVPTNPPTNPPSYVYINNNPPSLSGTTKDDSLNGSNGNNVISGGDGNDIITA